VLLLKVKRQLIITEASKRTKYIWKSWHALRQSGVFFSSMDNDSGCIYVDNDSDVTSRSQKNGKLFEVR